jgi:hypothetical protein
MGKRKDSEYKFKSYESLYPNIRFLTFERRRGAIRNLYDSSTHHAKAPVRDDGEASAILDCMESLAMESKKIIQLSRDEAENAQKLGLLPDGQQSFFEKQPWPKNKPKKKRTDQDNSST